MTINPSPAIAFHPFADGAVLHRLGSHRLWVLNVTAATLWCLLGETGDQDRLVRGYGDRFGLPPDMARRDVAALLEQFEGQGLLHAPGKEVLAGPRETIQIETPPSVKPQDIDRSGLPRLVLALAGIRFAVTLTDQEMARDFHALAGHLADGVEGPSALISLEVIESGADSGWFIGLVDGAAAADRLTPQAVTPFLVYALFEQAMAHLNHRLLFHAAVVAKNGRALLLPAESGSGKSTLAAALAASGWTYLSDELAVVNPWTLEVEAFALPIGLKDKSVHPLRAFVPGVADLPRHVRADGVGVRYFRPARIHSGSALAVAGLVFPRFQPEAATRLSPLPPLEALRRLAATGSSARPLHRSDIEAVLKLAQRPCFALEFSGLDAAVGCLSAFGQTGADKVLRF